MVSVMASGEMASVTVLSGVVSVTPVSGSTSEVVGGIYPLEIRGRYNLYAFGEVDPFCWSPLSVEVVLDVVGVGSKGCIASEACASTPAALTTETGARGTIPSTVEITVSTETTARTACHQDCIT